MTVFEDFAAGVSSAKIGSPHLSPRNSPAARPRDISVFATVSSSPGPQKGALPSAKPGPQRGQGIIPREHGKQECHFAIRQFGVRPDIDFTFKRSIGDFSPKHSNTQRTPSKSGHGCRSTSSDLREAVQAMQSILGKGPSVEFLGMRRMGSYSPRRDGGATEPTTVQRYQYRTECARLGVSDIDHIFKHGVGECSPRHHLTAGLLFAARMKHSDRDSSLNLITTESRMASTNPFRKKRSQHTMQADRTHMVVPDSPLSIRNPWGKQRSHSSKSLKSLINGETDQDHWALPTSSSRARHAQDLATVRQNLQGRFLEASSMGTRSLPSSTVGSQYSCRLAASDSPCMSTPPSTLGGSQYSCRLAPSSVEDSLKSNSSIRSTRTGSSYTNSHRSFKLAGEVLSELRATKGQRAPRPSHGGPSGHLCMHMAAPRMMPMNVPGGAKLVGNILAELRASRNRRMPTISDGFNAEEEISSIDEDDLPHVDEHLVDESFESAFTFKVGGKACVVTEDLSDPLSYGELGSSDKSFGETVCPDSLTTESVDLSDPFSAMDRGFSPDDLNDPFSVGDSDDSH